MLSLIIAIVVGFALLRFVSKTSSIPKASLAIFVVSGFFLGLIITTQAHAADANIVQYNKEGLVIDYIGGVDLKDDEKLDSIIKMWKLRYSVSKGSITVRLTSPGGYAATGWKAAAVLRKHGARTIVPKGSLCASACTYIFMGGVNRTLVGTLGYHQVSTSVNINEQAIGALLADTFERGQIWGLISAQQFMKYAPKDKAADIISFLHDIMIMSYERGNNIINLSDHKVCKEIGICG